MEGSAGTSRHISLTKCCCLSALPRNPAGQPTQKTPTGSLSSAVASVRPACSTRPSGSRGFLGGCDCRPCPHGLAHGRLLRTGRLNCTVTGRPGQRRAWPASGLWLLLQWALCLGSLAIQETWGAGGLIGHDNSLSQGPGAGSRQGAGPSCPTSERHGRWRSPSLGLLSLVCRPLLLPLPSLPCTPRALVSPASWSRF